jgi:hypothetical protein
MRLAGEQAAPSPVGGHVNYDERNRRVVVFFLHDYSKRLVGRP